MIDDIKEVNNYARNIGCLICIICYLSNVFSGEWWFIIPSILYFNAFVVLCQSFKAIKVDIINSENRLNELKELYKKIDNKED